MFANRLERAVCMKHSGVQSIPRSHAQENNFRCPHRNMMKHFWKTTSGEAFLYPGIKISLLFMLPAPQHAPSAYNWLPGNIHDLNMIRKVVPCCIEITTLVYPIAVDISSLQKCDWIHHFPDRHGWASFAMPFCQFR